MLFQCLLENKQIVTCRVIDIEEEYWTVEYLDDGVLIRDQIHHDKIEKIDHSLLEVT